MIDLDHHDWAALGLSHGHTSGPVLRVRIGARVDEVPLIGRTLRYEATDRRLCLGHPIVGGGHHDCRETPHVGDRRCERCRIKSAGFAANLHHAHTKGRSELSAAALEHLAQRNVLYIAAFRDGSLKVGTSTERRLDTRLTEQGAWLARVVADTDDGLVVRDLEDDITAELGVPQTVSVRRKLDGLVSPTTDAALRALLDDTAGSARSLIEAVVDSRLRSRDEAWQSTRLDDTRWAAVHRYPFDLGAAQHHVEIVDVIGRVGLLRRPGHGNDAFAADLGELFGVWVRPGDFESGEIAIQDSLF